MQPNDFKHLDLVRLGLEWSHEVSLISQIQIKVVTLLYKRSLNFLIKTEQKERAPDFLLEWGKKICCKIQV